MCDMSVDIGMSGEASDDGRRDGEVSKPNAEGPDRGPSLQGTVVRYDDKPDEYTLHPPNPTDRECTTTWITAEEGSYVSPFEWR